LYNEEKELRNTGNTKEADKLKKIAGFHWKKPTYYYQGFVNKSGMTEEESPENPIRVFPLNKKIHQMIFGSIFENDEDPFETLPCGEFTVDDVMALLDDSDEEVDMSIFDGYNFIVKKTQQGEYADWTSNSAWSKGKTPLTDEQLAAIAEHKLFDLTLRLPERPSDDNYEILVEMMNISIQRQVTGENGVWNPAWEEAGFKPLRQRGDAGKSTTPKSTPQTESDDDDAPKVGGDGGGTGNALERLKAARGKSKAAPEETTEAAAEEESPADVAAAADDAVPPVAGKTDVSDLASKIKARVSGKKTA
jgi:hypothetical protein